MISFVVNCEQLIAAEIVTERSLQRFSLVASNA
jgi:hypothetical protein